MAKLILFSVQRIRNECQTKYCNRSFCVKIIAQTYTLEFQLEGEGRING